MRLRIVEDMFRMEKVSGGGSILCYEDIVNSTLPLEILEQSSDMVRRLT